MKKAIFAKLLVLSGIFSALPAWAGTNTIYECSGNYDGQVILADVLSATSGHRYVQVTSEGERSFYLVDASKSKQGFFSANRVDPQSGEMLVGQVQLQIPSVLANKAKLNINGLKVDLKCSAAGVGGLRAY